MSYESAERHEEHEQDRPDIPAESGVVLGGGDGLIEPQSPEGPVDPEGSEPITSEAAELPASSGVGHEPLTQETELHVVGPAPFELPGERQLVETSAAAEDKGFDPAFDPDGSAAAAAS